MPAAERRAQILRCAIRVFASSTYRGATTRAIAQEAGVTEALIYRYFGNKRELFTQAIDVTTGRIVSGLERRLKDHDETPLEAIRVCIEYYVRAIEQGAEADRMIFLVLSELDQKDIQDAYLPNQQRALDLISTMFTKWKEKGLG